jgi:arylsulfatase A-like enzyme
MLRTLMSVDDMVAEIFRELRVLDETRNTLAIFISDNGYEWGEHRLRGKWRPYSESIHVPFAMRWPGHFDPGSTNTGIATNVDVAPTVLEAAGVAPGSPMDGVSLLQPGARNRLFTEFWGNADKGRPGWAQVRTRRVAYIEYYEADRSHPSFASTTGSTATAGSSATSSTTGIGSNNPNLSGWKALVRRYATCAGSTCPGAG